VLLVVSMQSNWAGSPAPPTSGPARATRFAVPVKGAIRCSNHASVRPIAARFRLSRGRPRCHDAGHMGVIAASETDLGPEGASKAVTDDDAGRAGSSERRLLEHAQDVVINLPTGGRPPSRQQGYEHYRDVSHTDLSR
jgi:hypothetical protein